MAPAPITSPATYGLLGLLASRSWTGYELTQQVRRSLRFVWPVSAGHLYREQKRLVQLGWATVTDEPAGRRTRKRYAITPEGRTALVAWLATEPEEPHLQIEGLLRTFYADSATPDDLAHAARCTAQAARGMCEELSGYAREYLTPDGPLELLRSGAALDGTARLERDGRPMFPERLPSVAVTLDVATALLEQLSDLFAQLADDVAAWDTTAGPTLVDDAQMRLQRAASRGKNRPAGDQSD